MLLLPKLLIAGALILAGVVLGGFARQRVDRLTYQLDFPLPLGGFAQITVIAVFGIIAAAQIGIPTLVLLILIAILVGGITGTFALSFGLGGRDVARAPRRPPAPRSAPTTGRYGLVELALVSSC